MKSINPHHSTMQVYYHPHFTDENINSVQPAGNLLTKLFIYTLCLWKEELRRLRERTYLISSRTSMWQRQDSDPSPLTPDPTTTPSLQLKTPNAWSSVWNTQRCHTGTSTEWKHAAQIREKGKRCWLCQQQYMPSRTENRPVGYGGRKGFGGASTASMTTWFCEASTGQWRVGSPWVGCLSR